MTRFPTPPKPNQASSGNQEHLVDRAANGLGARSDETPASKTISALAYLTIVGLSWFPISWVQHQWGVDGPRAMLLVLGPILIVGLVVLAWREHGPRRTTESRSSR